MIEGKVCFTSLRNAAAAIVSSLMLRSWFLLMDKSGVRIEYASEIMLSDSSSSSSKSAKSSYSSPAAAVRPPLYSVKKAKFLEKL